MEVTWEWYGGTMDLLTEPDDLRTGHLPAGPATARSPRSPGKDFRDALLYLGAVGYLAESANHHPDIDISWNKVTLNLVTHSAGGLTANDFALAREISALS